MGFYIVILTYLFLQKKNAFIFIFVLIKQLMISRMPAPENCHADIYQLMLRMWTFHPFDRPTFSTILEQMLLMEMLTPDDNTEVAEDGYITDVNIPKRPPPKPTSVDSSGYVADGVLATAKQDEAAPPRKPKPPQLQPQHQDQPHVSKRSDHAVSLTQQQQPMQSHPQQTRNRPIQQHQQPSDRPKHVAAAVEGRPQLRAATAEHGETSPYYKDGGYIDTSNMMFYPSPTMPMTYSGFQPGSYASLGFQIDVLATLHAIGLSIYGNAFLMYGLGYMDAALVSRLTDAALQQFGIFDLTHCQMIRTAFTRVAAGLCLICLLPRLFVEPFLH